jgi:hypothetical protein
MLRQLRPFATHLRHTPVAGSVSGSNPVPHTQAVRASLDTELVMLQGWQMPAAALKLFASHLQQQ